jgi:hypothetical protein
VQSGGRIEVFVIQLFSMGVFDLKKNQGVDTTTTFYSKESIIQ